MLRRARIGAPCTGESIPLESAYSQHDVAEIDHLVGFTQLRQSARRANVQVGYDDRPKRVAELPITLERVQLDHDVGKTDYVVGPSRITTDDVPPDISTRDYVFLDVDVGRLSGRQ